MSIFGKQLKEKREKLGYSVDEISSITTIQPRFIVALEEENFEAIPGDYYVKSFIKQYATILKLDANKLIKHYENVKTVSEQVRPEVLLQEELRKPSKDHEETVGDKPSKTIVVAAMQESSVPEGEEDVLANDVLRGENELQEELHDNDLSSAELVVDSLETADELANEEINEEIDEVLVEDDHSEGNRYAVVLDSDGLEETFVDNDAKEELLASTPDIPLATPLDNVQPTDEEPARLSKKLIGLLVLLAALIVALIWAIPNAMQAIAPKETMTQTQQSTLATHSTVAQTSTQSTTVQTNTETTMQTTVATETTTQVATTVLQETTAQPQVVQPEPVQVRPSNEPADLYIISSDAFQTTYGLGASYANYEGEYVVTLTASEPVWISVEIFGQKVHEGTMVPGVPYRMNAYNNAVYMKIRVGLSSALTVTFNDQPLAVPTYNRVQDYTFNFAR